MAWRRAWIGVSLIAMCGAWLAGCASNLPSWAQNKQSLADDISLPAEANSVRAQRADGPSVTLQKPLPPIDPALYLPQQPKPAAPVQNSGIQQASMVSRGTVRVSIRAWVNGVPIFDDEIINMVGPELARLAGSKRADAADKQAEVINVILQQLIDKEVIYQDALKKLEKNTKALRELKGFVSREFDKTMKKWKEHKIPEDRIREMEPVARRLLERELISNEYARARIIEIVKGAVNMELIREYYDTHNTEFRTVDKVVWQNIFIPVSPNNPTVADVKRFAEGLINKCRKSEDFNGLMVYNEGPTKLNNGEGVGQRRGEIRPAELEQHLFQLREGDIGPVIPFPTGVHLMRAVKREYEAQLPMDEKVQNTIRKKLEGLLAEREYKRIVRELRSRAVVRIEHAP